MNHAISNTGSEEADYYRRETKAAIADIAKERRDFAAEQILDAFDWKDVREAIELCAENNHDAFQALCASLARLQQISAKDMSKIEDRRVRDAIIALDKVARFYAGYMAAQEAV